MTERKITRTVAVIKWRVLITATLIQSILCGTLESYGALMVPVMSILPNDGQRAQKAALIGSLASGCLYFFSPVTSFLSKRIGVAPTGIMGGIIIFFATFTASFSSKFYYLLFTYGFMFGLGSSLVFTTNNIIIDQKFSENSVAEFAMLGIGNGVMNALMPHIMSYSVTKSSFSGALRLISILLSPIIFLPFFWIEDLPDELNFDLVVTSSQHLSQGDGVRDLSDRYTYGSDAAASIAAVAARATHRMMVRTKGSLDVYTESQENMRQSNINASRTRKFPTRMLSASGNRGFSKRNRRRQQLSRQTSQFSRQQWLTEIWDNDMVYLTRHGGEPNSSAQQRQQQPYPQQHYGDNVNISNIDGEERLSSFQKYSIKTQSYPKKVSQYIIKTSDEIIPKTSNYDPSNLISEKSKFVSGSINTYLHQSSDSFEIESSLNWTSSQESDSEVRLGNLVKNRNYINICVSMMIASLGYQVANIHIINYSKNLSFMSRNPQILLTCIGGASAIGPIINPLFIDKIEKLISKYRVFQIFVMGYGVSVTFLPLIDNYAMLITVCFIIGYFDGSFSTLLGPLMVDVVGRGRSSMALGFYYGAIALPITFAGPTAGFIYDKTKVYGLAFYIAGMFFLMGGFLLTFGSSTRNSLDEEYRPTSIQIKSKVNSKSKKVL